MKTLDRPMHDYLAEVCERTDIRTGVPLPIGTHEFEGGVNSAFFSRHATGVRLELFDLPADAPCPILVIRNETKDFVEVINGTVGAVNSGK
jgi:hypothetical protein